MLSRLSAAASRSKRGWSSVAAIPTLFRSNKTAVSVGSSSYLSTAAAAATATTTSPPYHAAQTIPNPEMFCRQCEQTKDHFACTSLGVCGKTPETAAVQDALMEVVKEVSAACVAVRADKTLESQSLLQETNVWTLEATFSTLTNVNFSETRICSLIEEGLSLNAQLQQRVPDHVSSLHITDTSLQGLEDFGRSVSIPHRAKQMDNDDCFSLTEIATYGLKGACAYAAHCHQLGVMDEQIMKEIHQHFFNLSKNEADLDQLLTLVDDVGATCFKVLQALDQAHADRLGVPEPTPVRTTAVKGKAILVSGHDMKDLQALLEQTQDTGVNVYTHGEMQPAHAYPELKKYPHLVGNYGTAWQNQTFEFAGFPGPIVVTTNCLIAPRRSYKNRIYTMNQVGFDGVSHIENRDFSQVIAQAKECKGFERTVEPAHYVTTGFNHRAVLPLAEDILQATQQGHLSRIFLIGGCDGSQWDRNYFTDLAEETPEDSIILTMGCAKNRVIHSPKLMEKTLPHSNLPRVLDMGQCNDSYSAVVVATELAKALGYGVNDLPLSLAVSHLEQKAACVLLCLLHLGVKDIRLGPSLPAYISPNVLEVLKKNYNLMPTTNATDDLAAMMEGK